jgi:hypothetical protein
MQSVLDTLERRMNIAAKVRQSVRSGGGQLSGEGSYWQQGRGNSRRSCWELKTLVAGEKAFFKQVYDGDFVWIDCQSPAARHISRIDVERVRRELAMADDLSERVADAAASVAKQELLARGGMTQLFAELARCFTFRAAQPARYEKGTALAIVGRWREAELLRAWPSIAAEGAVWPAQLPHHVLVQVDNDTLFPVLVEYRDVAQAGLLTSAAAPFSAEKPLARYEFLDVQFTAPMPEHLFLFAPAQLDWQDVTGRVLDTLRPPAAPAAAGEVTRRFGDWR